MTAAEPLVLHGLEEQEICIKEFVDPPHEKEINDKIHCFDSMPLVDTGSRSRIVGTRQVVFFMVTF